MRIRLFAILVVLTTVIFSTPAQAATPASTTMSLAVSATATWDGSIAFGVPLANEPYLCPNLPDGVTCEHFAVTFVGTAGRDSVARARIEPGIPPGNVDVYVYASDGHMVTYEPWPNDPIVVWQPIADTYDIVVVGTVAAGTAYRGTLTYTA